MIWITYCSWTKSRQNAHVCSGQQLSALYYNKGQKEATRLMKGHTAQLDQMAKTSQKLDPKIRETD